MPSYSTRPIEIRDSLYGLIPIPQEAIAIMQTPAFLRLDGIQQLGFASRVWPGAKHSRYEHSIGVMHLTWRALQHLRDRMEGTLITDTDANVVMAAALLHDIGHYPFSHAIEELGAPVLTHEEVGTHIILQSPIAELLEALWGVDPVRVAAMVSGETENQTPSDRLLHGLLSGTLDMDKLDYLPRDARACNVPYGGVDSDRLIASLRFVESPTGEYGIGIGSKSVSPLHSLKNARQEMFDNVYWHHTNRACMVMLLRAVQDAMLAGCLASEALTAHTDASFMALLQQSSMPDSTRRLAESLVTRRIHKRGIEISARAMPLYHQLGLLWYDPDRRRQVEMSMIAALRQLTRQPISDTGLLIDIPKPEKWKTDVWVEFDIPPIGMDSVMHWQEVVGLNDTHFKRYEEHRRLIRLVVEDQFVEIVRTHWEPLLLSALAEAEVDAEHE